MIILLSWLFCCSSLWLLSSTLKLITHDRHQLRFFFCTMKEQKTSFYIFCACMFASAALISNAKLQVQTSESVFVTLNLLICWMAVPSEMIIKFCQIYKLVDPLSTITASGSEEKDSTFLRLKICKHSGKSFK